MHINHRMVQHWLAVVRHRQQAGLDWEMTGYDLGYLSDSWPSRVNAANKARFDQYLAKEQARQAEKPEPLIKPIQVIRCGPDDWTVYRLIDRQWVQIARIWRDLDFDCYLLWDSILRKTDGTDYETFADAKAAAER